MSKIHPVSDSNMPGLTPKAGASSTKVESFGDQAVAFYSWYQSIRQKGFPQEGYHALQYIMKISEQGTATQEEKTNASEKLSLLMEAIEEGSKTLDQIPHELDKIVDGLTNHNAKNRVVMQATKIQISFNLSGLEAPHEFEEVINTLLGRVNPEMPSIQAEKISRTLQEALDQPEDSKGLKEKILTLLK